MNAHGMKHVHYWDAALLLHLRLFSIEESEGLTSLTWACCSQLPLQKKHPEEIAHMLNLFPVRCSQTRLWTMQLSPGGLPQHLPAVVETE